MHVARAIGAEILTVDSMQVYPGFDIGTAKPTPSERAEIPHHGLDFVDPREFCSAGRYLEHARAVVADAASRGVPILAVGGSGLYLKAMLHGLAPQAPADPELRRRLRSQEESRPGWMHERLTAVDPAAAARLHPHDLVRLERALEVEQLTGRRLSEIQAEHGFRSSPFRFQLHVLRRDRDDLRVRVRERLDRMFAAGWVAEVRALLASGLSEDAPAMRALGYRDVAAHLRGELSEADLRSRVETLTMRFAKRQTTWFNREPSVQWVDPSDDSEARFLDDAEGFLRSMGPPITPLSEI
jgi:tRNA dimethylallyltransferase